MYVYIYMHAQESVGSNPLSILKLTSTIAQLSLEWIGKLTLHYIIGVIYQLIYVRKRSPRESVKTVL